MEEQKVSENGMSVINAKCLRKAQKARKVDDLKENVVGLRDVFYWKNLMVYVLAYVASLITFTACQFVIKEQIIKACLKTSVSYMHYITTPEAQMMAFDSMVNWLYVIGALCVVAIICAISGYLFSREKAKKLLFVRFIFVLVGIMLGMYLFCDITVTLFLAKL